MCVYILHICVYACAYTPHAYTHAHIPVHTHTYIHTATLHTYTHTHTHKHTHTHTHSSRQWTHIHTCMHTATLHTYTHTQPTYHPQPEFRSPRLTSLVPEIPDDFPDPDPFPYPGHPARQFPGTPVEEETRVVGARISAARALSRRSKLTLRQDRNGEVADLALGRPHGCKPEAIVMFPK